MPLQTFLSNLDNAYLLVKLAQSIEDPQSKQLLYRSVIVLSVAHWQNFNEEVLLKFADFIEKRANSSNNLPHSVQREIGKWVMAKEQIEKYPSKTGKLIWDYAGGIWKEHYRALFQEKIEELNTPNSTNLIKLFKSILGIEDISISWSNEITSYTPSIKLDDILKIRHKIAHGSFCDTLIEEGMDEDINILKDIARVSYKLAENETSRILEYCGTLYSLETFDLIGLIKWLANLQEPRTFIVHDLSSINTSWFANHKKLSHDSWNLLDGPPNHRTTTDRFDDFIAGNISIPFEIVSFGGKDSIPKPGTRMVSYKDL